jgi:Rad3-related DNA helicase
VKSDKYVASQATASKDLEDRVMNPNIPKSETEWWAKREIEKLREKAAKWDKVKEIAAVCPVSGCPVYHDCNRDCLMHKIVNAIEGTKEDKTNG